MTPDEKFNEPCQSPTFPLLRLSSGRFGRNLCARLCARIEKSTYIQWRKCFIFRAPPVGLEPTTLWLTVINIFSIPFLWRYRKHWNSGITRDSKRVFGIFRTKLTRSKEASSDQKELHRCISTVPMDITIHSWGGNWTPSQKSLYLISYVSAIGWNALRGRLGCLAGWLSEKSSCK